LAGAGNQDTSASTNTATSGSGAATQSTISLTVTGAGQVDSGQGSGDEKESSTMEGNVGAQSNAHWRSGMFVSSKDSQGLEENNQETKSGRFRARQDSIARQDTLAAARRREQESNQSNYFTSTNILNTALGTGIVLWVIQGAQILAAILSTAPALIQLDPLSVLPNLTDQEEEEPEADAAGKLFDKK
jgi:hypothetical protein